MNTTATTDASEKHFQVGNRCLLLLLDERYLVGILEATADAIRVSFPHRDFPLAGMCVELEFHDEAGYTTYESEVLQPAHEVGDGLLLKRPPEWVRNNHRNYWRVQTNLTAEVKGHVHPRRHKMPVVDLSAGGMLVRTDAPLQVGDDADVSFALPGGVQAKLVAQVIHVPAPEPDQQEVLMGLRFVSPDPVTVRAISSFIRERLKEQHAEKRG